MHNFYVSLHVLRECTIVNPRSVRTRYTIIDLVTLMLFDSHFFARMKNAIQKRFRIIAANAFEEQSDYANGA